jgi:gamma-glutamyltranspeptidase/glutathione hydrolase
MNFTYPRQFNLRRSAVMAPNGMVATSHPLAVNPGLKVLGDDGTATDAAVGAAARLALLKPHNTGIGGDLSALTQFSGEYEALNTSGGASHAATIDRYNRALDGRSGKPPRVQNRAAFR